jgi:hypothetical protein
MTKNLLTPQQLARFPGINVRAWRPATDLATICKGGSSGYGWSHHSQLPACPELYRLAEVQQLEAKLYDRAGKLHALPFGILWHYMLEAYQCPRREIDPLPVLKKMLGVPPDERDKIETMFLLYRRRHPVAKEPFKVLATEIRLEVPIPDLDPKRHRYSVRYDAIVQYASGAIYSLEHKTASMIKGDTNATWYADSSIHGQVWAWNQHPLAQKYGPLTGVIMDIATKSKEPEYARFVQHLSPRQLGAHQRNLQYWSLLKDMFLREIGPDSEWPQNNKNCWGRYGPCAFVEHCHHGIDAKLRVKPSPATN